MVETPKSEGNDIGKKSSLNSKGINFFVELSEAKRLNRMRREIKVLQAEQKKEKELKKKDQNKKS
jgi:hypothetical protein